MSVEAVTAPVSAILCRSLADALSLGVGGAESVAVEESGVDAPDIAAGAMARVRGQEEEGGKRASADDGTLSFIRGRFGEQARMAKLRQALARRKWCQMVQTMALCRCT